MSGQTVGIGLEVDAVIIATCASPARGSGAVRSDLAGMLDRAAAVPLWLDSPTRPDPARPWTVTWML